MHMTIGYVDPEHVLRMIGGLGPLAGLGLSGTMDWTLEPIAGGTRITLHYVAGGYTTTDLRKFVLIVDQVQGAQRERVDLTAGDFVLKRRDGLYAYQLAVVVDDLRMEIDEVVRGADLLASTARQVQLLAALGGRRPAYAHVPLMLGAGGEKLSKRDPALTLAGLRAAGAAPAQVTGYLAWSLGLLDAPRPCLPADLAADFDWLRVGRGDFVLPEDVTARVLAVR